MVNSRLPHGEFLVFIDSLLEREENTVRYKTRFPFVPTLPMLCEAGAQGSSFFSFFLRTAMQLLCSHIGM